MPDWHPKPADGGTEALTVDVAPYIEFRGMVLWHSHSDAMTVAHKDAALRQAKHEVRSKRVPGWRHLLWLVRPQTARTSRPGG